MDDCKVTFEEYEAFIEGLSGKEADSIGLDPTSCWAFSYFFHKKFNLPITDYFDCKYEEEISPDETGHVLEKGDGMYSFDMINSLFSHRFIVVLRGNTVKLMTTYGGQKGLNQFKYTKSEFEKDLLRLCSYGEGHAYSRVSGYTENYFNTEPFDMGYTYRPLPPT